MTQESARSAHEPDEAAARHLHEHAGGFRGRRVSPKDPSIVLRGRHTEVGRTAVHLQIRTLDALRSPCAVEGRIPALRCAQVGYGSFHLFRSGRRLRPGPPGAVPQVTRITYGGVDPAVIHQAVARGLITETWPGEGFEYLHPHSFSVFLRWLGLAFFPTQTRHGKSETVRGCNSAHRVNQALALQATAGTAAPAPRQWVIAAHPCRPRAVAQAVSGNQGSSDPAVRQRRSPRQQKTGCISCLHVRQTTRSDH